MIINANCNEMKQKLAEIFENLEDFGGPSKQSIMSKILKTPGNEEIFLRPLPPRNIHLCLVVMEGLDKEGILEMASSYQEQTYHNWNIVLFARN